MKQSYCHLLQVMNHLLFNVEDAALARIRSSEKLSLMVVNKEWKESRLVALGIHYYS